MHLVSWFVDIAHEPGPQMVQFIVCHPAFIEGFLPSDCISLDNLVDFSQSRRTGNIVANQIQLSSHLALFAKKFDSNLLHRNKAIYYSA